LPEVISVARAAGDGIAGDGHHAILRVEAGGQR